MFWDDTKNFTNLIMAGQGDNGGWPNNFYETVTRCVNENKSIYLTLGLNNENASNYNQSQKEKDKDTIRKIINTVQNIPGWWDKVKYIELTDEPHWSSKEDIKNRIDMVKEVLNSFNLPKRPLGACYTLNLVGSSKDDSHCKLKYSDLDWISFQAYLDYYPNNNYKQDHDSLLVHIKKFVDRVNAPECTDTKIEKDIMLAIQAYDRDPNPQQSSKAIWWRNIDRLVELQMSSYDIAKFFKDYTGANNNILALNYFSYMRPGGAFSHPELLEVHIPVWNAINNIIPSEVSATIMSNKLSSEATLVSSSIDGSISLYPTLTYKSITLRGIDETIKYKILSSSGKLLSEGLVNNNETIDISVLSSGLYFIRLLDKAKPVTLKFIKK